MRYKLISSRWKLMMIIPSIFLTLNSVVSGSELNYFKLLINYNTLLVIKNKY